MLKIHNLNWILFNRLLLYFFTAGLFFCFLLGNNQAVSSQTTDCVRFSKDKQAFNLGGKISYFEDIGGKLALEEITDNSERLWNTIQGEVPSFGFSSSAYWLRFDLCKSSLEDERIILEIEYPLLDSIGFFVFRDDKLIDQEHSGDGIAFSQRLVKHRNFLFYLPEPLDSPLRVYIRVQTESAVQIPIKIYTQSGFAIHEQKILFLQGLYFGIILAMILYNTFLFFSIREIPYLYYVCFTISYFSFQAVLQGFFQQYFLGSAWWQNHALLIFGFSSIAFANMFASAFLKLKQHKPAYSYVLYGIGCLSFTAAALSSILPYVLMVKVMLSLSLISSFLIIFAGLLLWLVGHLPAKIFTLAWLPLLISFILASLNKFALLPRSFWTENIMQIGGVLEVILLSIALGVRISEEKQQRILIEQRLTSSLEEEVKERTHSLKQALKQLETANAALDKISQTDGLTELANRRAFDAQFEIEYLDACRSGDPLSLLITDIDYFKQVNDVHGHQAGDQVLKEVAKSLSVNATRPRDKVYRFGGEEFAVILGNTDLNGSLIVAQKMRKLVKQLQFIFDSGPCSVTISSGGCTLVPTESDNSSVPTLEEIIKEADNKLYQAKKKGRDRVEGSIIG